MLYRKVEQVAEEVDSLKESLDRYLRWNQKQMLEAKEREELLGRAVCIPHSSLYIHIRDDAATDSMRSL